VEGRGPQATEAGQVTGAGEQVATRRYTSGPVGHSRGIKSLGRSGQCGCGASGQAGRGGWRTHQKWPPLARIWLRLSRKRSAGIGGRRRHLWSRAALPAAGTLGHADVRVAARYAHIVNPAGRNPALFIPVKVV